MQKNRNVRRFRQYLAVLAFVVVSLTGVAVVSMPALATVLINGVGALAVIAPPALMGIWLVSLIPMGPMPRRWHFLLGSAVGLGATALLVLLLGMASLLYRPVWIILMAAFAAVGILHLRSRLREPPPAPQSSGRHNGASDSRGLSALWWLLIPFASAALLAASNPPGMIWAEEGYGYDTLEYHLELPKEYRQAGRIAYTPHNVYGSFPSNVEMLYLLGMVLHDDDVDFGMTANMIHLLFAVGMVWAAWVAGRELSPRAGVMCAVLTAGTGWLVYLSGLAYVENGMLFFGMTAAAALLRAMLHACRAQQAERRSSGAVAQAREHAPRRSRLQADAGTGGDARTRLTWVILAGVLAGLSCGCKYTAFPMIALPLALIAFFIPSALLRGRIVSVLVFITAALVSVSPWLVRNMVATGNPVFPLANSLWEGAPPGWGAEESAVWDRAHQPLESEQSIGAKVADFWKRIPGDPYQRFGPALFLLAIGGLWGRKRDWMDGVLLMIVGVQLLVWLFATHLYARFAVVMLIPLVLLGGRALSDSASAARRRTIVFLLVAGCAWNFVFVARLLAAESVAGTTASLLYEGELAGYEYLGYVNRKLPGNAKVLLVGDARAFYFKRNVDYWVVFNRNPFIEAVRKAKSGKEIVDWLVQHGYTHVLVNWSEIRRLARTYGFASEITPELFERLSLQGLRLEREFPHPPGTGRHVSVYRVRDNTRQRSMG